LYCIYVGGVGGSDGDGCNGVLLGFDFGVVFGFAFGVDSGNEVENSFELVVVSNIFLVLGLIILGSVILNIWVVIPFDKPVC